MKIVESEGVIHEGLYMRHYGTPYFLRNANVGVVSQHPKEGRGGGGGGERGEESGDGSAKKKKSAQEYILVTTALS